MIHHSRLSPGILVIGGYFFSSSGSATPSVEFWFPSNPEEGSCELDDYPREVYNGPTVHLVSGQLVACYEESCEIHNGGGEWNHLVATRSRRRYHSSAVNQNRLLLIGGAASRSTEWIPVDGSPSQPGPFYVRHGYAHCTLQLSADTIVVTGGDDTWQYVTSYKLTANEDKTPLTPMKRGRMGHACGVFQDAGGQQVNRL